MRAPNVEGVEVVVQRPEVLVADVNVRLSDIEKKVVVAVAEGIRR